MLLLRTLRLGDRKASNKLQTLTRATDIEQFVSSNFESEMNNRPELYNKFERKGIAVEACYSFIKEKFSHPRDSRRLFAQRVENT